MQTGKADDWRLTAVLAGIATALFLVYMVASHAPSYQEQRAKGDKRFLTACLTHGFTADQCDFFRHAPEDDSAPP